MKFKNIVKSSAALAVMFPLVGKSLAQTTDVSDLNVLFIKIEGTETGRAILHRDIYAKALPGREDKTPELIANTQSVKERGNPPSALFNEMGGMLASGKRCTVEIVDNLKKRSMTIVTSGPNQERMVIGVRNDLIRKIGGVAGSVDCKPN